MYFKEKDDTNIDKEFEKERKKGLNIDFKNLSPKTMLFLGGGILLLFIVIFVVISLSSNSNRYVLTLSGEQTISITVGSDYIEPGYKATDKKGNDFTNRVQITSNLDTSKIGEYEILYSIGNTNKVRNVKVVEKVDATYIRLLGEVTMYLEIGEKYKEPGYEAYDSIDGNVTKKVTVSGKVNSSKKGVYKIKYTVVNSRNITTAEERNVIVVEKGQKP